MRRYGALSVALLMLALVAAQSVPAKAAEPAKTPAIVVDFDGDGIDDNLADLDGNTIPDRFERTPTAVDKPAPQGILGDVFDAGFTPPPETGGSDRAAAFGARQFPTRAIQPHRAGFGADEKFGPGNDIGIGSLSSGCAGGVCHF